MTNTEKSTIIIVECLSSSVNYIKDIYDMGYEPVLLEPYYRSFLTTRYLRKYHDRELDALLETDVPRPSVITAKPTYEETLSVVRELHPLAVIPGSDNGVRMAAKLASDLGLTGNDPQNLDKMCNKFVCQKTLKAAGIRCIESALVSELKEALPFLRHMKECGKAAILKPVSGISSFGVFLIETEEDLRKGLQFNKTINGRMHDGGTGKMLLQEYIDGEDYTIDTVSSRGVHKVTTIYKTEKSVIKGAARVHDKQYCIDSQSDTAKEIIDYTLKVLDAVGFEYGASNCDIMVDKDGPVLIEINPRICGCSRPSAFQEKALGMHESKLSLLSYLHPDEVLKDERLVVYDEQKKWLVKYIILKRPVFAFRLNIQEIAEKLYGFDHVFYHKQKGCFQATRDLSTNLAYVFFVGEDSAGLEGSYQTLKIIEEEEPKRLYTGL